jgi:hypothetical protein
MSLACGLLTGATMPADEIEILAREREWLAIERCAKLAESFKGRWNDRPDDVASQIARAIRALWKPKRIRRGRQMEKGRRSGPS